MRATQRVALFVIFATIPPLCSAGTPPTGSAEPMKSITAYPGLVEHTQPDGRVFRARQFGDERYHWMETEDGYTIQLNRKTGFFEYVRVKNGRFVLTGLVVGRDDPAAAGIAKHLRESKSVIRQKQIFTAPNIQRAAPSPKPELYPNSGDIPVLVILANFDDTTTSVDPADFDTLFNANPFTDASTSRSVWHYYNEVSYGNVNIQATIVGWIQLSGDKASYGDPDTNAINMVAEAIDILYQNGFDFSPFDVDGDGILEPIIVIHSGEGEEISGDPADIWSHQWAFNPPYPVDNSSTSPGELGLAVQEYTTDPELQYGSTVTLGVICHEMGHAFGLIDLYDYDYDSAGVGDWAIMAHGSWNGVDRPGDTPSHWCAWSKALVGWLDPTIDNGMLIKVPLIGGELPPVETEPVIYRINMGDDPDTSTEYLLLENRQLIGYDQALPNCGLLIWHIDDLVETNDDQQHYHVALLQADGQRDLEKNNNYGDLGDPFPGWNVVREIGPYSPSDENFYKPNTNSYYGGDTNIWVVNISDPLPYMTMDIRFFPNLFFDPEPDISMPPVRPPIVFSDGSQRNVFTPGDPFPYLLDIVNIDDNFPFAVLCEDIHRPFWIEFWASRTGGLSFDYYAIPSIRYDAGLPGNSSIEISGQDYLYSFPDGAYTPTVTIDRPQDIRESAENNNRWALPGASFILLRTPTGADLTVRDFSFGPNWAKAGDTIQLGGRVVNEGTGDSGPFWIEFWGSADAPDKYYPTLDFFLCDSVHIDNLPPGGSIDLSNYTRTLNPVPDHDMMQTFSVGCFVDRTDLVNETNETNNYQFIGPVYFSTIEGVVPANYFDREKALAALTPPPQPDLSREQSELPELAVRWSTVTLSGQEPPLYLEVDLTVHNWGLTTASATWSHVYVSRDALLSPDDYLWISGVRVPELPPGAEYSTAILTGPPDVPLGAYQMLAQCDVIDEVVESHEENNVLDAGPVLVGPDITFETVWFDELQPNVVQSLGVKFSEPGSSVTIYMRVVNNGIIGAGPFWLEIWGSRLGGLSLDDFLVNSEMIYGGIGPLSGLDLVWYKKLRSIPDGPYTLTPVADRPNDVTEVYEGNNRGPVAGKRLVELRPTRLINLRVPVFRFAPNPIRPGATIKFNGSVVNDGPEHSGPFWIEFWGSYDQWMPTPDFQLCDSIYIDNLRPGQQVFLQPYQRTVYWNVPTGEFTIICIADRPDNIAEANETDNYKFARHVKIVP